MRTSSAGPGIVGERHYAIAQEIRRTLAQYEELKDIIVMLGLEQLYVQDRKVVVRARQLERFLTQPFFTTEHFTGRSGKSVPLPQVLDDCERILNDGCADWAEADLYMIGTLDEALRREIAGPIEAEARKLLDDKVAEVPDTLEGKTVVIEFARGCADGQTYPFPHPFGYQGSLGQLSPAILAKSSILYIWVEPEESRRKNAARTDPNDPGSILHHGVPLAVMYGDYGTCDMAHLLETSGRPDTVKISRDGRDYFLPLGRFDNRVDKTTFIREEPATWAEADVHPLGH